MQMHSRAHLRADRWKHEHGHFGYLQLRTSCERYMLRFDWSCSTQSGNLYEYTITLRKM